MLGDYKALRKGGKKNDISQFLLNLA